MKTSLTFILAAGLLACSSAPADTIGSAVTLELRSDDRGPLPLFPAASGPDGPRAYAEAVKGAGYRLVVHNTLSCRVGLGIAVDGRNIISGAKSWLKSDERMYILGPGETQEYSGWRTAQDKVNRFYFTNAEDSYAGAFNDLSAMGVVAMAVYPEFIPVPPRPPFILDRFNRPCAPGGPSLGMARKAPQPGAEAQGEAGTGYGEEVYSPSITVAFQPDARAREKLTVKYEWRETLMRMGVIRDLPVRRNRLWDSGVAPPPPPRL